MAEGSAGLLTSTVGKLPGYRIVSDCGLVRGIVVRSRGLLGSILASLQTIWGGNITMYTQMCEQAREEAYKVMLNHAAAKGANAVIGIFYDSAELMQGCTEVLCYGTAVVVEREA